METGLVYRNALVYRLAMTVLEGREGAERRRRIAESVPEGSSVVDLCCGDARIAAALVERGCTYVGLDINRRFVDSARRRGLDVRHWDAASLDIPRGDVVCMLSSLYHFIPDEQRIFDRMLASANEMVIVSEPTSNWSTSGSAVLRRIARTMTKVNGSAFTERHSEESIRALVAHLPPERVELTTTGREVLLTVRVSGT